MNTSAILSQPVTTATDALITALLQAEPIAAYLQAKSAMDVDEATQALLKRYAAVQSEFRQRQANGTLTQDLIDQVRQLQQQVQSDANVAAFVVAQFPARNVLDTLTDELSNMLGLDFSSVANVSAC